MRIRKRFRQAFIIGVALVGTVAAGCDNADTSCAAAVEQYEQLRADAIARDPALSAQPAITAEHLRQTRQVFVEPVRARCAADPRVARCIAQSATINDAQKCL